MEEQFVHFDVGGIALKIAVAVGIGMLIGLERNWSHKEVGIRTFSIVSLTGMLAVQISNSLVVGGLAAVCLLVLIFNVRSFLTDRNTEITTSAALIACYMLGVLTGMGHIFTPVAGTIVITMLLAWKTELSKFAGGLETSEIRSYFARADRFCDLSLIAQPVCRPVAVVQPQRCMDQHYSHSRDRVSELCVPENFQLQRALSRRCVWRTGQ